MASATPIAIPAGSQKHPIGEFARSLLEQQRAKNDLFGMSACDSAWEMLLYLLIQREDRRAVSIADLCRSTTVPIEVAMRWVLALEEAGHIAVNSCPGTTGRLVELNSGTAERLRHLIGGWISG